MRCCYLIFVAGVLAAVAVVSQDARVVQTLTVYAGERVAFPLDLERIGTAPVVEVRFAFRFDPELLRFERIEESDHSLSTSSRAVAGTRYQEIEVRWRPSHPVPKGRIATLIFEALTPTSSESGVRLPLHRFELTFADGSVVRGAEVPAFHVDSADPELLNPDRLIILERPASLDAFRARTHPHRLSD